MKRPQAVHLSRADGEALHKRLTSNALTADDRRVLGHVLEWYFWLVFTVQDARVSLKRLRTLLFGKPPKPRKGPLPDRPPGSDTGGGGTTAAARRPGHGRYGAEELCDRLRHGSFSLFRQHAIVQEYRPTALLQPLGF